MKVKFKWNDVENDDFIAMNKIVGRDILLSYPNFINSFIIHTGSRKKHLGLLIIQNGKPIAFSSHKLTPDQINYMTT